MEGALPALSHARMPRHLQYATHVPVCHASMPRFLQYATHPKARGFGGGPPKPRWGDLPSHVWGISQATLSGGFIFHGLIKLLSAGRQSEVPKFLGV